MEPTSYITRLGKNVPADKVFEAWTSGELDKMFKVTEIKTNSIDRHFLLQSIVSETYKLRKEKNYKNICLEYCQKHINEFPLLASDLKEDCGGTLPRVPTFQNYATILTELEEFEKAIEICRIAISFGLNDGTKNGYKGRIKRIIKKRN